MSKTIAALASAPGISGLSVIRISGDEAFEITDKLFKGKTKISEASSHTIHYGKIVSRETLVDTVTASVFKAPNSYTGEDVVEIGCHGGNLIYTKILEEIYANGAHIPLPGEFTKRAFLNGKLDLSQVEAVSDLIHSVSNQGASASARQLEGKFTIKLSELRQSLLEIAGLLELELDFSEEDLELIDRKVVDAKISGAISFCRDIVDQFTGSEILRSGFQIAIVGYPNAGKSTLFNSLLDRDRAIVSNIPGTTRDYLEEQLYLKNIPARIVDTAGLRDSEDIIEIEGIKLVESVLKKSNVILVLNDVSEGVSHSNNLYEDLKFKYPNVILVQNKVDLVNDVEGISAKNQTGLDKLKEELYLTANTSVERVNDALINQRHKDLLEKAIGSLENARASNNNNAENEIIAIDIRDAVKIVGEITGESWNEEVLEKIFSGFCIGK